MMRTRFALVGVLLAVFAGVGTAGDESAKTPRADLYGDPLPPGAVARLGTIRLRHASADVAFSKDGKQLISCGADGEVRVWDAATGKLVRRRRLPCKPPSYEPYPSAGLSPDGSTVALWNEATVCIYDTHTGAERGRLPADNYIFSPPPKFSPDGEVLAAQISGNPTSQVLLWDVKHKKTRCILERPPLGFQFTALAFTADGKRLIGKDGLHLFLWDAVSGKKKEAPTLKGSRAPAFSPDGKTLAVGVMEPVGTPSPGEVRLLDAVTFREKELLKGPAAAEARWRIDRLAFSPDGRLLAGAYNDLNQISGGGVLLWDVKRSAEARRLPEGSDARIAFAPDGKTLASRSDFGSEIHLWDTASCRPLSHRPGHGHPVAALASSPNGKLLASGDAGGAALFLWDISSGRSLYQRPIEDDIGASVCLFSPDGSRLITAGLRESVRIWDAAKGKEVQRLAVSATPNFLYYHALGISRGGERLMAITSEAMKLSKEPQPAKLSTWDLTGGKQRRDRPYRLENRTHETPAGNRLTHGFAHTAFTPDGDRMTVWLGDRVGMEETATGHLLAALPKNVGAPLTFSSDGRLLAAAVVQPKKEPWLGNDVKGLAVIEAASGDEIFRKAVAEPARFAFTPDGRGVVVADREKLSVWDTATGAKWREMAWSESIRNARGEVTFFPLVVLPGGRVATGMGGGDILIWDLAPATWPAREPVGELDRAKRDALWSDLARNARNAHRAIVALTAAPTQTVPLLKDRLRPAAEVDAKDIEKWLADLDGEDFARRESASRELSGLCDRIEPILRRTLEDRPSLEVRRRLQAILANPRCPSAERLRTLRAIAVLERIDTPKARSILEKLASGAACRETQEAQAALQRLKHR
ncbi:MAG TPA: WD40 repeat domain-containing protein [Gemmataceae bacterium]